MKKKWACMTARSLKMQQGHAAWTNSMGMQHDM
jgi:hypothetical protein